MRITAEEIVRRDSSFGDICRWHLLNWVQNIVSFKIKQRDQICHCIVWLSLKYVLYSSSHNVSTKMLRCCLDLYFKSQPWCKSSQAISDYGHYCFFIDAYGRHRWSWTWKARTSLGPTRLPPPPPAAAAPGRAACAGVFHLRYGVMFFVPKSVPIETGIVFHVKWATSAKSSHDVINTSLHFEFQNFLSRNQRDWKKNSVPRGTYLFWIRKQTSPFLSPRSLLLHHQPWKLGSTHLQS